MIRAATSQRRRAARRPSHHAGNCSAAPGRLRAGGARPGASAREPSGRRGRPGRRPRGGGPVPGLRPGLEVRPGQPERHQRPDRRVRQRLPAGLRRLELAGRRRAARLGHLPHPGGPARNQQWHRVPADRPGLVPQALHAAPVSGRPADLARVRRRLHELHRLAQRPAAGEPPLRLHRLQLRRHQPGAHRRGDRERPRRPGAERAAEQPVVLRQRHLPQRLPGRHRPGARGAARHLRDHTGPGEQPPVRVRGRAGPDGRRQRRRRGGHRRPGAHDHRPTRPARRAGHGHGERARPARPSPPPSR